MRHWIEINRAPVLTLWAAIVAKRLGFDWDEALTLGRAVAGLNAYSKGRALGLFERTPEVSPRRGRRCGGRRAPSQSIFCVERSRRYLQKME